MDTGWRWTPKREEQADCEKAKEKSWEGDVAAEIESSGSGGGGRGAVGLDDNGAC
jgi:hypothetical protein